MRYIYCLIDLEHQETVKVDINKKGMTIKE